MIQDNKKNHAPSADRKNNSAKEGVLRRDSDYRDLVFYAHHCKNLPLDYFYAKRKKIKADFLKLPISNDFKNQPHIFVIGDARSGTRWLLEIIRTILLLKNKNFFYVEESIGFRNELQGKKVNEYPFLEFVLENNPYFSRNEKLILQKNFHSKEKMLELFCQPGQFLLGKTWHTLAQELSSSFPHARIIFIQRDPRNILISQKHFFHPKYKSFRDILMTIKECNDLAERQNGLKVVYENFLNNPSKEIDKLAKFLGIKLSKKEIREIIPSIAFKNMSGGRSFGQYENGSYFRGGSDWEIELSASEKKKINEKFKNDILDLGYKI